MEVGHLGDGFVADSSLQRILYQNLQSSLLSVFPVDQVEIMLRFLHYCYSPKVAEISDLTSRDC